MKKIPRKGTSVLFRPIGGNSMIAEGIVGGVEKEKIERHGKEISTGNDLIEMKVPAGQSCKPGIYYVYPEDLQEFRR